MVYNDQSCSFNNTVRDNFTASYYAGYEKTYLQKANRIYSTKSSRKPKRIDLVDVSAKNPNNKTWQVWQQHNQPIELLNNELIEQRLNYLHLNPVNAGLVDKPEDWTFSSAKQYVGLQGMLSLEIIE